MQALNTFRCVSFLRGSGTLMPILNQRPNFGINLTKLDSVGLLSIGDTHSSRVTSPSDSQVAVHKMAFLQVDWALNQSGACRRTSTSGRSPPEFLTPVGYFKPKLIFSNISISKFYVRKSQTPNPIFEIFKPQINSDHTPLNPGPQLLQSQPLPKTRNP